MHFEEWLIGRDPQLVEALQQEARLLSYLSNGRLGRVGRWLGAFPLYLSLATNTPIKADDPRLLASPIKHAKRFAMENPGGKSRYARQMSAHDRVQHRAEMQPTYNQPVPSLVIDPNTLEPTEKWNLRSLNTVQ